MEHVNTNYKLGIDFYLSLIINVISLCLIILILVEIWLDYG